MYDSIEQILSAVLKMPDDTELCLLLEERRPIFSNLVRKVKDTIKFLADCESSYQESWHTILVDIMNTNNLQGVAHLRTFRDKLLTAFGFYAELLRPFLQNVDLYDVALACYNTHWDRPTQKSEIMGNRGNEPELLNLYKEFWVKLQYSKLPEYSQYLVNGIEDTYKLPDPIVELDAYEYYIEKCAVAWGQCFTYFKQEIQAQRNISDSELKKITASREAKEVASTYKGLCTFLDFEKTSRLIPDEDGARDLTKYKPRGLDQITKSIIQSVSEFLEPNTNGLDNVSESQHRVRQNRTVVLDRTGLRQPDGGNVMARIFHLSDIHFGRFHDHVDTDQPAKEAQLEYAETWLQYCRSLDEDQKPDIVVISGDLTSIAHDNEFRKAEKFLRTLSSNGYLKQGSRAVAERILVVPGNHDVRRIGVKGDRLEAFRIASRSWPVRTCFSGKTETSIIRDTNIRPSSESGNSFLAVFDEYKCVFNLLTSCTYGEDIWQEVSYLARSTWAGFCRCWMSNKEAKAKKKLRDEMSLRKGFMSLTYEAEISSALRDIVDSNRIQNYARFAVLHHPPVDIAPNVSWHGGNGASTRNKLHTWGYHAALCGHIHRVYNQEEGRNLFHNGIHVIASGSLGSVDTSEKSFLLIDLMDNSTNIPKIEVKKCTFSGNRVWKHPAEGEVVFSLSGL